MIELRKITHDNFEAVLKLSITDEQKGNVDSSIYSLARAYVRILNDEKPPMIFAICHHDEVIGYVDMGFYKQAESSFLREKYGDKSTYGINRFMIDVKHQGKGFGKQAMMKVIDYIMSFPQGKADAVSLSYWLVNEAARKLYASVGFIETGAIWDGQTGGNWNAERKDIEYAEVGARLGL
ncbi:GNAT family N-acetyltransferase [Sporosarcina sp. BI001-red]|uniref:GNAT family N-acetyltransferase n=1 Tax=Sporosarcina sp. BI001-red TaxID=2282866 RepID=UPI000E243947|nr:GNAT family N-acetyltransferase [Sporosarcina sp. BI001-red]REB07343.1 GNAT family N-acetyltransferase [Sporosarcina sp. BI001-red]